MLPRTDAQTGSAANAAGMKLAALSYARHHRTRFAVFPAGLNCRHPLCEHGCHDASADPDVISKLWARNPDANIALASGPVSGVFVLDVDVKSLDGLTELALLEGQYGGLPITWTAKTPSGGQHLYFRQPDRPLRNRVGFRPGLDVRAAGGSVALPPSQRPDGSYLWKVSPTASDVADAPIWLLDLIAPPATPVAPRRPLKLTGLNRTVRYIEAAVDGECGALAIMAKGSGRNSKLFQAAANLAELVAGGLLPRQLAEDALEDAAKACGLAQEDGLAAIRATIASGFRHGLERPRRLG